jgi:hypothetical protein
MVFVSPLFYQVDGEKGGRRKREGEGREKGKQRRKGKERERWGYILLSSLLTFLLGI